MTPNSRPPQSSIRSTAVRGVTLLFAAGFVARVAAIATLYVTGVLLTKEDFALYAIAVAWGEMFSFLQNGGLHRLLLQRARSFDQLHAPVLGLALAINSVWFLILVALSPLIGAGYSAPGVTVLIVVIALSIPLGTMAFQLRAYLQINMRYAEISALDVYSALIRNGGVIFLAFAGFGPLSFVLPVIAVVVFETVFLCRRRPASLRPSWPRRTLLRAIAAPCLWIMAGMLAMSFTVNGDYLVIGAMEDKVIVGTYFFGFRLTVAVLVIFTRSLRSVFVPSFVALGHDPPRQEAAFLRSLDSAAFLLFFILFAIAVIAEPVVNLIWSGKWDAAVPIVEIVAVASLARVVSPIARSLLEARGAWRTVALMTWIEGLGLMASAAIGAFLGGLVEIALSVGAYMTLAGILYILVVFRRTSLSLAALGKSVFVPYAISGAALASGWMLGAYQPIPGAIGEIVVRAFGFTAAFAILLALFRRDLIQLAFSFVRGRLSR